MTNAVTDLCLTSQGETWLASGSIAALRFISSVEGHGFSFSYLSLPQNKSVSGKIFFLHKNFFRISSFVH